MLIENTDNVKVKLMELHFQFKRIISSQENLRDMQIEFNDFASEKSKNFHKIKIFLLGKIIIHDILANYILHKSRCHKSLVDDGRSSI